MRETYKRWKYNGVAASVIAARKKLLPKPDSKPKPGLPDSFFILGSGRNGSTVLAKHLNAHPEIFLPPEMWELPFTVMRYYLHLGQRWEQFIDRTLQGIRSNNQKWRLSDEDYKSIQGSLHDLDPEYRNLPNVMHYVFDFYSKKYKSDVRYVGDQSPINTRYYKVVLPEFQNSKFIFLLRDPLDVIHSFSKLKHHPLSNPVLAASIWNQSIDAYNYIRKQLQKPVLLVKYGDMVSEPQRVFSDIMDFLDLPYKDLTNPSILSKQQDIVSAEGYAHLQKVKAPLSTSSIGKGHQNLPPEVLQTVLPLVRENAEKFNYL